MPCLELYHRLVTDLPLSPHVPSSIQGATVMSGLTAFLTRRQYNLWGSEFLLFSCFQAQTLMIFFFLPRIVYLVQLFLKNWPLFRNIHGFKFGSGSRNHSSRKPSMMPLSLVRDPSPSTPHMLKCL